MSNSSFRSTIAAGRTLGYAALGFVTPAFAAISVPAQPWSTYLLYGSIALLIAGAVGKMLTYGVRTPAQEHANAPRPFSIGIYRNSVLNPSD